MNYLEVKDVIKQYDGHRALDGVSIAVPKNRIYGLLGPNGAGKTTLIRIINHITAPDSGRVEIEGRPMHAGDIRNIGYLPEERGLYKKMKVGEQIVYLAQLKGVPKQEAKKRMKEWLARFEIAGWEKKKIEELSKGMQQKIQFITTVIHRPELLIFDEPFSGFDPVNANLLKHEILELQKEGATIIFSTHNMESVEELCDEITLINHSRVVLQGAVNEIKERYKKHLFRVRLSGNPITGQPGHFTIRSEKPVYRGTEIILQKDSVLNNNELIGFLTEGDRQILSFEEVLPSMNEIFIDTVEGKYTETAAKN